MLSSLLLLKQKRVLLTQQFVKPVAATRLCILFLGSTKNIIYESINGICLIYTITTMLAFVSVVLLHFDSWNQLFNLFKQHYKYKLFAEIIVILFVVTEQINACE